MGIFIMLGYLKANIHKFENLETITGSSAGAVIGFFLSLGWHPDRITDAILSIDPKTCYKPSIRTLVTKWGLTELDALRSVLEELAGCNPTFKDIDMEFYVTAYCLTTGKTVYFSKFTHPNVHVLDTVIMSCSIPLIVKPIKYKECLYVDGGFSELIPLQTILDKKADECMVVRPLNDKTIPIKSPRNILDFLKILTHAIVCFMRERPFSHTYQLVDIDMTGFNAIDFNMSYEDKLKMIMHGTTIF